MSQALGQGGAIQWAMPFRPGEYRESTGAEALDLDHLLGHRWQTDDGDVLMLVKNHTVTTVAPRARGYKWQAYTSKTVTAGTVAENLAGVGDNNLPAAQVIPSGAYFYLHVDGEFYVSQGDDGAAFVTAGEYAVLDNDGDTGRFKTAGNATFVNPQTTVLMALETATVDEQEALVRAILPLVG